MRSAGRRAAFVAALVGLLAALGGSVPAASAATGIVRTSTAVQSDVTSVSARSTGVASDVVRTAAPVAARTTSVDRAHAQHLGAGLAALLLVLAACLLAVGLRRLHARVLLAELAGRAAPRAPPVAAPHLS
jgi:hypothetical protein